MALEYRPTIVFKWFVIINTERNKRECDEHVSSE